MSAESSTTKVTTPLANPPSNTYQYKHFPDKHSFRLICLFPSRCNDASAIECSLLIAEFPSHQAPIPYEAISYVWGDPNDKVDIVCDKKSLSITVSLREVLRRVRLPHSVRILWADGICINQEDVEEKSNQVSLMGLIYLRANQVLAWIGHDDGGAERAARLVKKLRKGFEDFLEDNDDLYVGKVLNASDKADLEFVVHILERPLFNRVWIIQELGIARGISFLYGPVEIDHIDLHFFIQCMAGSYDAYELGHYTNYARLYTSLTVFRPLLNKDEQLPDLLDLLLIGQSHDSTDPRDHVFALRAHPSAGMWITRPDYNRTVSQVFTEVTSGLVKHSKTLRVLSAVHHDEFTKDNGLPSWVPALHQATLVNPLGIDEKFYYIADFGVGVSDTTILQSTSEEVLEVCGFVFDTVRIYAPPQPFHDGENISFESPPSLKGFKEAFTICQFQGTAEDEKRLEAFGLTMVAGLVDSTPAETSMAEHRSNFAAFLIAEHDKDPHSDWTLPLTRNTKLLNKVRGDSANGSKERFTRDAYVFWNCRRFFRTVKGYLGLGPQSLMEGDLCCVLFGAKVPFVLRKADRGYILVGECYIQGIMRGEAIEMWRSGGSEVERFNLR